MAKVYVSSTIADLKPERQAVLDWLRAARHQAVDSYLPDSDTVRDSCLDDVGTCDLYVLILGHRYGFVPGDDNPGGLSITQLEFRRAGQCGIPRVALLRTSEPDVRLSDLQDPARAPLVLRFRDEVARTVRPAEFSDEGGLIRGLSTGIQAALAKLDQRSASRAAGPVLRLAPRPAFLAGREELLAELDARLTGDGGAGPRVVALCGLGGAGKTSVALEYAHSVVGEVGLAWQFHAQDTAVLADEFGQLAAQLGVLDLVDARDPVDSVHGALAAYPAEWLLIFDNAPDRKAVEQFLPPTGRGRVLITSRSALWPTGQALEVPVLDAEVAADYLVRLTDDADRRAALELAGELGGLPLALEQAAAYIQASTSSLARYLLLWRQRRPDLLARGEPARSGDTVATTWSLAFSRLEQSAPSAVGLLRLLAYCAPESIPVRLLLQQPQPGLAYDLGGEVAAVLTPLLEDELEVDAALAAMRPYSLFTPAGDGLVSVHRLVQAVTADQMPADLAGRWHHAAAVLVEATVPADTQPPAAWPKCALLLPHARAVLGLTSGGMWRIALYLAHSGCYLTARDLFQLIADAHAEHDAYGAEHRSTLAARAEVAMWTGKAGDEAGARDQFAALLPIQERVLGPEDPLTLDTRCNLALWTGEAGDAARARDQFAALLPIQQRVLGPEHPHTLDTRADFAGSTGTAGDAAGARDQLAALLPIYERVLGPENLDTLDVRGMLAYWTGKAGDAARARDQFAALLPIQQRMLGEEHPLTLATSGNLARYTGETGDATGARDQLAALLPIEERVRGREHPRTLDTRADLACWTGEAGDAAGARDQLAALLPIRERVIGDKHPDTLTIRRDLAYWTAQAGDAAAARDQLAVLLPIEEGVLGPEHPRTLADRSGLAIWTGEAGDAAAARDQLSVLLPIQERVMGAEHPYTLAAGARLAVWTGEAGDAAGARDQLAALLPVIERVLGDEHPETLIDRSNLAVWTGEAGDAAGARDQLAALLPIRDRVSGPEHPGTLTDRARLARWTGAAGDAAGARDQYAALLPIEERVHGAEHPDTLTTRANLAHWTEEADRRGN
jgi:hypothetical protein